MQGATCTWRSDWFLTEIRDLAGDGEVIVLFSWSSF